METMNYTEGGIRVQEIDARTLVEGLLSTTRLIDEHEYFIILLSHYHDIQVKGQQLDYQRLGELLGVHIDLVENKAQALALPKTFRHIHVQYGEDIEKSMSVIFDALVEEGRVGMGISKRHIALHLLENSLAELPTTYLPGEKVLNVVNTQRDYLEKRHKTSIKELLDFQRRAFVEGALHETLTTIEQPNTFSEKLDTILTNKWFGFPILFIVLYVMFEATFAIGAYPQAWVENGMAWLMEWVRSNMVSAWYTDMLVDGLIAGVGAVFSFLPSILILFVILAFLEQCNYMSRVAYLMDGLMHRVGLHGRSFIPLLLGFGCNVPAIMVAKDIENRKNRWLTMLMVPFMSCSARLPVYIFFVNFFFPRHKALVMISMYLIGITLSILFALIMRRTRYFKQEHEDYVTSLPTMELPSLRVMARTTWERSLDYLQKIVSVVIWSSILIWALTYFPTQDVNTSYLAQFGQWAEGIVRPLGFDWQMLVCLITGLPAKETVVSTMAILFPGDAILSVCTPLTAYTFMVFVLLYFPCLETVMTLRKNINARWAWFSIAHSLITAWLVAFVIYHVGLLFV